MSKRGVETWSRKKKMGSEDDEEGIPTIPTPVPSEVISEIARLHGQYIHNEEPSVPNNNNSLIDLILINVYFMQKLWTTTEMPINTPFKVLVRQILDEVSERM
uniref:Uncharacterized protein n=2 Tax=Caenorhabditis japonica TaxID=281687 RepID=A0A8R1EP84_CAEJA